MKKIITTGIFMLVLLGLSWSVLSNYIETSKIKEESVAKSEATKVVSVLDENGDDVTVDISMWKTYTNEEHGFSVKYPPDMQVNVPVMDVVLRGLDNTVFIVGFTREDLENVDLFSGEVGYGIQIDTKKRESFLPFLQEVNENPERVIERTTIINNGSQEVSSYKVLEGFAKDSVFAYFPINDRYYFFAMSGEKYTFAEYLAFLSTFTVN